MIELVLGSALVAAIVSGLMNAAIKIMDYRRDDAIRTFERDEARKDRRDELERQDRFSVLEGDRKRLEERRADGRAQARILLGQLESWQNALIEQGPLEAFRTYTYRADLVKPIRSTTRLIPDAAFREYIDLGVSVVTESWVAASVGEGPEGAAEEQLRIVTELIAQSGRFVTDDGWDHSLIIPLRSAKDALDDLYEQYHRNS